ncbi:hypothetical protein RRG08_008778 [Elysia crispata]|uniref:Uncharacterized protein n=1 Tax=Elysia crispata TaxID=231223 RepID=A0AAE1DBD6_9GAST|nr:hypothetical protein RRG08_008778 [Elysia crispata]
MENEDLQNEIELGSYSISHIERILNPRQMDPADLCAIKKLLAGSSATYHACRVVSSPNSAPEYLIEKGSISINASHHRSAGDCFGRDVYGYI